ncbi:hypothetical protein HJC23_011988 [Cyclotella cryptica]|uniref:TauD/TfdA-like domain-containing protein n=1 Tax=Cyclotella cryptica TaxID=29204 RepID=A0ABD3QRM6_9STRA|eukprot:CCRYP_003036-RA/>CCRYP_003036-RA protein AED:0.00 eAED:0.00 QI:135/-1/1/1/-1/1/1/165/683
MDYEFIERQQQVVADEGSGSTSGWSTSHANDEDSTVTTDGDSHRSSSSDDDGVDSETSLEDENVMNEEFLHADEVAQYWDERDLHGRDYFEDYSHNERGRYRHIVVVSLSLLLTILIIVLSFQVVELYNAGIKGDDASNRTSSRRIFGFEEATIDPIHPKETQENNNKEAEFTMPREITRIYTHSALSSKNYRAGGILSEEMLLQYERDGVLVIRNLISPKLLERLDDAGTILIEREKHASKSKMGRKGKQFHMVKNGAIFLGVPPPRGNLSDGSNSCIANSEAGSDHCDANASRTEALFGTPDNTTIILSSFRDVAMYSKIPRVAASLLRLDELRVGGAEHLNVGSKRARELSRRRNSQSKVEGQEQSTQVEDDLVIDDSVNLRICRDIFLTKDDDPYACGWHVDDTGFWPSIADDPGVNAWIALDDMPWPWSSSHPDENDLESGRASSANTSTTDHPPVATFALSIGSHRAPWRHEAYHTTGSTHTQPPEGFQSAADLIERRTGSGTCNIEFSAPDLYEKLEERKVVYDLKRGDVIFHDRWVFHRTVTADEYGKMAGGRHTKRSNEPNVKIFRRYSIRYSPGTARVPPGYGFELSVLHNPENGNRTLNEIVERDGPFYPKVWPHVLKKKPSRGSLHGSEAIYEDEIEGLAELVFDKIPQAEKIQKERKKEVIRLLAARGRI